MAWQKTLWKLYLTKCAAKLCPNLRHKKWFTMANDKSCVSIKSSSCNKVWYQIRLITWTNPNECYFPGFLGNSTAKNMFSCQFCADLDSLVTQSQTTKHHQLQKSFLAPVKKLVISLLQNIIGFLMTVMRGDWCIFAKCISDAVL